MANSNIYFKYLSKVLIIVVLYHISSCVTSNSHPFILFPQPTFLEPIPNVTVSAGRDVSLSCVIENLGSYRVAWSHKGNNTLLSIQERVIMRNSRYTISHQNYRTWYLHIKKIEKSDSGFYMCQVNTTPMISQMGHIEVVVAPSIVDNETSSDTDVREGSDVSFKCTASGSPKPAIKWRREDDAEMLLENRKVHEFQSEFLNFTSVSRLIMGAYLCIASNGIPPSISKRIMLNVLFPPMIWIPNQLIGVAIGEETSIDCHLEAFPDPVTYWTKGPNHVVVVSDETRDSIVMRTGMYKINMRLSFRSMATKDYGAYTCIAKNSLGETQGKIRLYEIAPVRTATSTKVSQNADVEKRLSSDIKTLSSGSANSQNLEEMKTVWSNPSEKGSIEAGETNGALYNAQSGFLQNTLFAVFHIFNWLF